MFCKIFLKTNALFFIFFRSFFQKLVGKAKDEKWNVWSLEGGLETLISKLSQRLQKDGVTIKTKDIKNNTTTIHEEEKQDFTFLSTPAYVSSQHISSNDFMDYKEDTIDDIRTLLESIPYVDVAVINVMFKGTHFINEPAFGFLVPSTESNVPILGVIYDTCSFPQGDNTILTVMMGGAWFEQLFGQNPNPKGLYFISSLLKKEDVFAEVL